MSRRGECFGRLAIAVGSLFVCATLAPAEESATKANATSLEEAKRALQVLERDAGRGEELSTKLPRAELPTLEIADPMAAPTFSRQMKKDRQKDGRSAKPDATRNWLVDAMMKTDSSDRAKTDNRLLLPTTTTSDEDHEEPSLLALTEAAEERTEKAKAAEAARDPVRDTNASLPNPLDSFMAAWMSERDFRLLAPVASARNAETPFTTVTSSSSARPNLGSGASTFVPSLSVDSAERLRATAFVSGNPYLESLEMVDVAQRQNAFNAPAAEIPAPRALPVVETRPPKIPEKNEEQKSRLSEQLRGNDDAKYFKQLKRF